MTEDFKKWLCELAGISSNGIFTVDTIIGIGVLIKAMWAINSKWDNVINFHSVAIMPTAVVVYHPDMMKNMIYKYVEYSEQKALEKALQYIWEQENK